MEQREDNIAFARKLRAEQTELERSVWARLRHHRHDGHHWRRQHPIGPYFADFYCARAGLVLEIDGASHRDSYEHDQARDAYMASLGLRVLRVDSHAFAKDFDGTMSRIWRITAGEEEVWPRS